MEYQVVWRIEIEAASPREAAVDALAIHRDPGSTAIVFEVTDLVTQEMCMVDLEVCGGN